MLLPVPKFASPESPPPDFERPLSADAVLATNLIVARRVLGMTQHDLADASGISRATIAQLETGSSDPRLSTVVQLAKALGVPPVVLLTGVPEAQGFVAILRVGKEDVQVPAAELRKMRAYVASGSVKDRLRASQVGASVGRHLHAGSPAAAVAAAIVSVSLPGPATLAGAAFGSAQLNP